ERSIAKSHLKLAGIVERNGEGLLQLRNSIYYRTFDEQWVNDHLPVNWQRRLQRITLTTLAAILILNLTISGYAWNQRREALRFGKQLEASLNGEGQARKESEHQTQLANDNALRADQNAVKANQQEREAARQAQLATKNALRANQKATEAEIQQRLTEA